MRWAGAQGVWSVPGLLLPSSRKTEREKEAEGEGRRQGLLAGRRVGLSGRSGTGRARTCSATGAAARAPGLRRSLCHVTREPRRLRRRPGPSNADRIASAPPHPPRFRCRPAHCACARSGGPAPRTPAPAAAISGRRHLRDVASEAPRGRWAHAHWESLPPG